MKKLLLVLLVFVLFLSGCATQADVDKAYSEGYKNGYADGEMLSKAEYKKGYDIGYSAGRADAFSDYFSDIGDSLSRSTPSPTDLTAATDYVLNTNSKKFHLPYCESVGDMAEKNKQFFSGTRDEVIAMGYVPCKRCGP